MATHRISRMTWNSSPKNACLGQMRLPWSTRLSLSDHVRQGTADEEKQAYNDQNRPAGAQALRPDEDPLQSAVGLSGACGGKPGEVVSGEIC